MKKRYAVVFLLPDCDIRCRFCITQENFGIFPEERSAELLKNLKSQGYEGVIFGGGEPTLWPGNLRALATTARGLGFSVQIGTHAMHLPKGFETWEEVSRWVLPLESTEPGPHNHLRPTGGDHHEMILDCLESLGAAGRSVTISTVVSRVNSPCLAELGQWLDRYSKRFGNLHAWHLYRLVERGRMGGLFGAGLQIPLKDYRKIIELEKIHDRDFHVFKRENMTQSRDVGFFAFRNGHLDHAEL